MLQTIMIFPDLTILINPHITVGKLDDAQSLNKIFEYIRESY